MNVSIPHNKPSLSVHEIRAAKAVVDIWLAKLKQLNRKDRKEQSLCGLCGSDSRSIALFGARFTDG
jgi:hypothetical protein